MKLWANNSVPDFNNKKNFRISFFYQFSIFLFSFEVLLHFSLTFILCLRNENVDKYQAQNTDTSVEPENLLIQIIDN